MHGSGGGGGGVTAVNSTALTAACRVVSGVGGTTGARRAAALDRASDMFDFVSASDTVKKQNRRGAARFKAII